MHTFRGGDYVAELMAELDRAEISQRINEALDQRAGLTQREAGDLLHVHWRTVQDWSNPKHQNVPWDRLDEIGRVSGVTKEWLLHGEAIEAAGDLQERAVAVVERFERIAARLEEVLESSQDGRPEPPGDPGTAAGHSS